ncbi:MAG: nickel pincer cofactor biosynthesis protein LarC [Acidobacteria bacterium]|nr:nickel pincer cofactor biosynthesis protein LarC [Acidobacteriota bacterium]
MTKTQPRLSGDILFIEPSSGASGDMMIGALLDLGFSFEELREKLLLLPLDGYRLSAEKCNRSGIQATKFNVHEEHEHHHHHNHHHHRTFADIRAMIEGSRLSCRVKEKSIEAFRRLAEAEGKIHGHPADHVHFHEVGAVDSIVDIVGTMIIMESFRSMRVISSAVNVGQGTLECQHGVYPVPGPAAQELLRDVPIFSNSITGELTTPTGAALLTTLTDEFGARPPMKITATGYGAGTRETPGGANVLRISVGEAFSETPAASAEQVAVIEAAIDDMNPQIFGYFQEKAMAAGALDVYAESIQMKKNRPALKITCVCAVADIRRFAEIIFRETTTIGIRYIIADRMTLRREFREVLTQYGPVTMKVSLFDGRPVNFIPEFEDCRRLAEQTGKPLKEIQAAAAHAYMAE